MDMAQALDLVVCNSGSTPTQEKDGQKSYINVTPVSASLRRKVVGWDVPKEKKLSVTTIIWCLLLE